MTNIITSSGVSPCAIQPELSADKVTPMPPSNPARCIDPIDKKARVIRAARRLFVAQGFHGTSIPQVVAASGVSTGAIYSYFATKEDLARHIHDTTLADFTQRFEARLAGRTSCEERLRAFAEVVIELTDDDPEMMEYLLFMRHADFMPGLEPICLTSPFTAFRAIIGAGVASGDLRQVEPILLAIAYSGVILRAAQLRLKCILDRPLRTIADELIAAAWAAVHA